MDHPRLILCGTPAVEPGGGRAALRSRKGLALLAYLALTRRRVGRTTLAELFWPDHERADGLTNLRRTLYRVRATLGRDGVEVVGDRLGLPGKGLWVDVWAFRDALEAHQRHADVASLRADELLEITRRCQGPLLDGLRLPDCPAFETWLALEREAHLQMLCRVFRQLAEGALGRGESGAALHWAWRWTALDPLAEPAHRLVMRAHASRGDVPAAIECYEAWRALLDRELGMPPGAETEALHRALRAGEPLPPPGRTAFVPEVRYARSGGLHIAYQVVGDGVTDLVLAPGFVSHLEHLWRSPPLRAVLGRLAQRTRLVLFDRRGVGLSERVGAAPTLYATATDLQAVLDATGSATAVLFGFSEGGPAALLYAALHPQRVRGLVLYGTMARGLRARDYPWALDAAQFDRWLERLVAAWGRPVPHEAFAPSHVADASLWRWYGELMRLGSSPGGVRAVLGALRDLDVRSLLAHVEAPTLLLQRRGDRVVRVGAGRYLAERLKGARYVELEGEDHWWWLGDSETFLREVDAFIEEVASRPPPATTVRTALAVQAGPGASVDTAHPDPLAALEATEHVDRRAAKGLRAAIHCSSSARDAARVARGLASAARPGEVLATDRVHDIARAVGYEFAARDPAAGVGASAQMRLWALTRRPS